MPLAVNPQVQKAHLVVRPHVQILRPVVRPHVQRRLPVVRPPPPVVLESGHLLRHCVPIGERQPHLVVPIGERQPHHLVPIGVRQPHLVVPIDGHLIDHHGFPVVRQLHHHGFPVVYPQYPVVPQDVLPPLPQAHG